MHFPKYWALGEWTGTDLDGNTTSRDAWGWSDSSEAEARRNGEAHARKQVESWSERTQREQHHSYGYPNRPLREPVLSRIESHAQVSAVITRNSYGCDVLNTDRALFVDIDLPAPKPVGLFSRLFGRAQPTGDPQAALVAETLAQLEAWCRSRPELTFRAYRTAGGLRYLLISTLLGAEDALALDTLVQLGSDPNYRRLCRQQKSFRARLTPKPYRCKLRNPPHRYPFRSERENDRFAAWLEKYRAAARSYAVCRLLRTVGREPMLRDLEPILATHDRLTGAATSLPLA